MFEPVLVDPLRPPVGPFVVGERVLRPRERRLSHAPAGGRPPVIAPAVVRANDDLFADELLARPVELLVRRIPAERFECPVAVEPEDGHRTQIDCLPQQRNRPLLVA